MKLNRNLVEDAVHGIFLLLGLVTVAGWVEFSGTGIHKDCQ